MALSLQTKEVWLYLKGHSIPEVSQKTGIPLSTVRFRLKALGILRSRGEGVRVAASKGKLGPMKGQKRQPFSQSWKDNIKAGRLAWCEKHAKGTCHKPSGYIEYTRGPNKGKLEHVALMEARLGRKLLADEVVHHIDENRSNNAINNLALMTRSAHSRHHQIIRKLKKCQAH